MDMVNIQFWNGSKPYFPEVYLTVAQLTRKGLYSGKAVDILMKTYAVLKINVIFFFMTLL